MGKKPIRYFDYSLMILLLFLLAFGLIMLYSTSSYYGATRYDDSAYYVKRQMVAALLGLAAMLVISILDEGQRVGIPCGTGTLYCGYFPGR